LKNLQSGSTTIGRLLGGIFLIGLLLASLVLYSVFVNYRTHTVRIMAHNEARHISGLVFEHLYSVMRKGWTREEIDSVVHNIQHHLPGYAVTVVRGEPVIREYGDRPGQAELRARDPLLQAVLAGGEEQFVVVDRNLHYIFPVRMSGECLTCHTQVAVGEVNGVISINVPLDTLESPIVDMARRLMYLALTMFLTLLAVIYLVLRFRVSQPISSLAKQVSALAGSDDYARKVEYAKEWPQELQSLAGNFNALMEQVNNSHEQLRELSLHDPLTGLFNRRHFDAVIDQAAIDCNQGSLPFSVMLIDLDHFKPINDTYGHAAGDAMLVCIAKALQGAIRETDVAVRLGGDEFAVIALGTLGNEASDFAERLRQAIEAPKLRFGSSVVQPACSIGIASFPDDGLLSVDLLRRADENMYADKTRRRKAR
jgi:diguanylate cyclase (GGDEF)-like protein